MHNQNLTHWVKENTMAKQATTRNDKFRGNDPNQPSLGASPSVDTSGLVPMEKTFMPRFTDSDTGMSSEARSTDDNLSRKMTQIMLTQADDVTLGPSIAEAIRNTFDVDCCLIAVSRNFPEAMAMASSIDWYVSTSDRIKEQISENVNSLPSAANLQPLWDAMVTEPEKLVKAKASAVFSELGPSCWLSQLDGSLMAIAAPPNGPVVGGLVLIAMQPLLWTESKMKQLQEVSNQVAIAISNLEQQRKISSYKQKVQSIRQQQNVIHEMTMAIHNWSDVDRVLQMAIDKLVDSLQVERGLILLLKYQDPLYKSRALGQFSKSRGGRKRIPRAKVTVVCESSLAVSPEMADDLGNESSVPSSLVDESFWLSDCAWCQQAFRQAPEPTYMPETTEFSATNKDSIKMNSSILTRDRMQSGINVPIIALSSPGAGNTILGFLLLQDSSERHWSPEELNMMELVGTQLGNAILQNQTLQQVQALVEDRNAQLKRSMEVQAKLYELTRQQVDQLRRLNEVKDEFLDTLNHELKTPLATMRMAIENLRRPGNSEQRQAMYLDMMQSQLNRETKLVNDLLKLRELELRNSNIQLEMLDLKPFLEHLAENFDQTWSEKELTLSLKWPKKSVILQTDPKNLEHAIVELLTNAGKYSDTSTTVELQVMEQTATSEIIIKVTNIGAGISPEDLPHIFEKFRRGQGMTKQAVAGTGLGLALVKSLIEHLNGTITVTSVPLQETEDLDNDSVAWESCFTVTLPQQTKMPAI